MEGHLTMSKKERARLVVMAKVMKSEMKISEASELLGFSLSADVSDCEAVWGRRGRGAGASESRSGIESGVG